MKTILPFLQLILIFMLSNCSTPRTVEKTDFSHTDYKSYPVYGGKDLGLTYSPKSSLFKLWAPTATQVKLKLYDGWQKCPTLMLNQ
jgi:hypothetical protein